MSPDWVGALAVAALMLLLSPWGLAWLDADDEAWPPEADEPIDYVPTDDGWAYGRGPR